MEDASGVDMGSIDSMEERLMDVALDVEWLRTRPKPIALTFSWPVIAAIVVVSASALVLDFLAFRASELKRPARASRQQQQQQKQHNREEQPQQSNGNTNGHTLTGTTPAGSGAGFSDGTVGVGGVVSGKSGTAAVVTVQPSRRPGVGADETPAHYKRALILSAWILGALVCHSMGLAILARVFATVGAFVGCLPHLLRPSKYRRDGGLGCSLEPSDKRRSVTDMLVWTSLVYVVPSLYGLAVHQYGIAALQLMTTIGSTLFHLTRETKFFNLDNVFATSLLVTTIWGFFLGVTHGIWWYVAMIGIGGPFAVFCIVRCGMPGLVCRHPSGHGLCRRSNPEYDFFHMLWHLSSGLGTLVSIHFFEINFPAEEAGGGWFHFFPDIPVVPTVSLAISALINFYGNHIGLMPLA